MSELKRLVQYKACRIIENRGYDKPENACGDCVNAVVDFVLELKGAVSFVVEVQVDRDLEETPWGDKNFNYEGVWHCVAAIPEIGIVDITGSQFKEPPLRIMNEVPESWKVVRRVERTPYAPKQVCDWMEIGSDNNSYEPTEVFKELLNVNQKFSSEHA